MKWARDLSWWANWSFGGATRLRETPSLPAGHAPARVENPTASSPSLGPTGDGPDFLCIGMQKAGTGWLYDQLRLHPDFWMPLKEFHYLNHAVPKIKKASRGVKAASKTGLSLKRDARRARPVEDRLFFRDIGALQGVEMNLARYAALFNHKGSLLSGDITPAYAMLRPKTIVEIAERFPNLKIALLVRDPVARVWSSLAMRHRKGKVDLERLSGDAADLRGYLAYSGALDDASFPIRVMEHWKLHAPNLPFRTFLFDDIEQAPDLAREAIVSYLGGEPSKASGKLHSGHNKKAIFARLAMTDVARNVLVDCFKDELRSCASVFEGAAREWPKRYGL